MTEDRQPPRTFHTFIGKPSNDNNLQSLSPAAVNKDGHTVIYRPRVFYVFPDRPSVVVGEVELIEAFLSEAISAIIANDNDQ
jgi:hypothetical protein